MSFSAISWTNLDKAKTADALRALAKDGTQELALLAEELAKTPADPGRSPW